MSRSIFHLKVEEIKRRKTEKTNREQNQGTNGAKSQDTPPIVHPPWAMKAQTAGGAKILTELSISIRSDCHEMEFVLDRAMLAPCYGEWHVRRLAS